MADDNCNTDKPFGGTDSLSGSHIEHLRNWLAENVPPSKLLARSYTVGNMVSDLDEILSGMWSDGIDAMGEDA